MASEISVTYGTGRYWTGSMIELGFQQSEYSFQAHSWTSSEGDSAFRRATRDGNFSRRSRLSEKQLGNLIAHECLLGHLLEATAKTQGTKKQSQPPVNDSHLARYLLEILNEKTLIRHSLTSLLPTEENMISSLPSETALSRSRHFRSYSSEPEFQGRERTVSPSPNRHTITLSSLDLETNAGLSQLPTSCPILRPRKRLSLSDSEIRYVQIDGEEEATDEPKENEKVKLERDEKKVLEEDEKEAGEEQEDEEMVAAVVAGAIGDNSHFDSTEETNRPSTSYGIFTLENASSARSEGAASEEPGQEEGEAEKPRPIERKSVRFADEVGSPLYQETIIADTTLPPVLKKIGYELLIDDDFGDMYDDALPGVFRPNIGSIGSKHSHSLPDLKVKMPPPVPGAVPLHRVSSNSDNTTITQPLGSPLRSPISPLGGWRPTFPQPAVQYLAFRQRLEGKYVSLENVSISQSKTGEDMVRFYGTVKVKNISFSKHVILRVTMDKWATHKDYPAVHDPQLSQPSSSFDGVNRFDTFMFNFGVDFTGVAAPRELQFAVCFRAGENASGGEFWDNNDGCNYVVVEETSPPNDYHNSHAKSNSVFRSTPPSSTVSVGPTPRRASVGVLDSLSMSPPTSAYTLDYRPNFTGFSSLTTYSSWQHYSSEAMYY